MMDYPDPISDDIDKWPGTDEYISLSPDCTSPVIGQQLDDAVMLSSSQASLVKRTALMPLPENDEPSSHASGRSYESAAAMASSLARPAETDGATLLLDDSVDLELGVHVVVPMASESPGGADRSAPVHAAAAGHSVDAAAPGGGASCRVGPDPNFS